MKKTIYTIMFLTMIFQACQKTAETSNENPSTQYFAVSQSPFGKIASGEETALYTLKSPSGMKIGISNYGAVINSWFAPNKDGVYEDVVLGFDSVSGYVQNPSYFGAVVGRYGNRIDKGQFSLDGETYTLATNNSPNHLHGGIVGFDKVIWNAKEFVTDTTAGLVLTYLSKDMEEGYPGNLKAQVTYTLSGDDALRIDYLATTDKKTVVNLTQHSYFNLSGNVSRDILGHQLEIASNVITPVDSTLITTGEMMPVEGTPFDFRTATVIGARINETNEQIKFGLGYDHNWVIDTTAFGEYGFALAAVLSDSISGRKMEVLTVEPGIQFYSGNFLDGTAVGKKGAVYKNRSGVCLETQHYPDSPNKPDFPTSELNPGEEYKTTTVYRFSVQ